MRRVSLESGTLACTVLLWVTRATTRSTTALTTSTGSRSQTSRTSETAATAWLPHTTPTASTPATPSWQSAHPSLTSSSAVEELSSPRSSSPSSL
uniref:Putative secreted protein n=1 Tax=Ixodes ricinus TaxID=34613 RepID=A0A6B0U986_IXORI